MHFEIIGNINSIQTIAVGKSIRNIARLRKQYGAGRWRKLKGIATVRLFDGTIRKAEVHWYEHTALAERNSRSNALWISEL
jgi:hypothetical protein